MPVPEWPEWHGRTHRELMVRCWGLSCRGHEAAGMSLHDHGRVKTQKGRLRRGIAFYRRCGFRVILLPVARTLRWRGRSFYAFLTLRYFRTAKTRCGPQLRSPVATQQTRERA